MVHVPCREKTALKWSLWCYKMVQKEENEAKDWKEERQAYGDWIFSGTSTPPRLQPEDFFEITLKVIDSSRFLCFGTPSR